MAAAPPPPREGAERLFSDAAAWGECGGVHELSRKCGDWIREARGGGGDGYLPGVRLAERPEEHEGRDGSRPGDARYLRRGHLLYGGHSRPEAEQVFAEVLCGAGP